mgnify:CR=1 FL=1
MSTKEQYWKYSLIVIILFMGIIIFRQITPFLGGLLGALTIYILVRGQMRYLVEKRKLKRSLSALLITAETIFVFLIPLGLTVWMVVNKLQDINLDPQTYIAPIQQVAEFIKEKTGYDVLGKDTLTFIVSILPRIGQIIMESISSLAINLFVMIFVLYFMLIGGKKIEAYEKLQKTADYEIARKLLDYETDSHETLPPRIRLKCQRVIEQGYDSKLDAVYAEIDLATEAAAKVYADEFRPALSKKREIFEAIYRSIQEQADCILQFDRTK